MKHIILTILFLVSFSVAYDGSGFVPGVSNPNTNINNTIPSTQGIQDGISEQLPDIQLNGNLDDYNVNDALKNTINTPEFNDIFQNKDGGIDLSGIQDKANDMLNGSGMNVDQLKNRIEQRAQDYMNGQVFGSVKKNAKDALNSAVKDVGGTIDMSGLVEGGGAILSLFQGGCSKGTSLSWTDQAACDFDAMAKNYKAIASYDKNRVSGSISLGNAEENDKMVEGQVSSSSGGTPITVDPNTATGQLFILRGSASINGNFDHLQPFFKTRLIAMAKEYKQATGRKLIINSAYRSVAWQRDKFKWAVRKYGSVAKARKHVAPPGRSRHNFGLAVDISMGTGKRNQVDQLASMGLLKKYNLWRPMSHEYWHVEPIETAAQRKKGIVAPLNAEAGTTAMVSTNMQYGTFQSELLTQQYGILQTKSQYIQEVDLLITEQLITRNKGLAEEALDSMVEKLMGITNNKK